MFSETIQEQKSILNLDFNKVVSLNYKSAPFMTNIIMETNCGVIYHNGPNTSNRSSRWCL